MTIAKFVLRILAWSAVLFPAWHFASPWIARPVAAGAALVAESVASIDDASPSFPAAGISFRLKPAASTIMARGLPPDVSAEILLDARKHTYGLPFFFALMLAGSVRSRAWKIAAGSIAILASAALGLGCELLVQAGSLSGPGRSAFFPIGAAAKEAIAVGYQLGVLIFPTVIPVLLWGIFARASLVRA